MKEMLDSLTAEEAYLWECARSWRAPVSPANLESIDWLRLVELGHKNKMATLLVQILRQAGLIHHLPGPALDSLHEGQAKLAQKARELTAVCQKLMPLAAAHQLEVMPLKGLWLSCRLYDNAAVRPGHDLDVLVRREQVDETIRLLEEIGFGRYWPDSLADEYYKRHHLHLELSLPDCWTWVEVHWAFDHPRTCLTIDYESMLDRATPGQLLGVPVHDPDPADLLLYQCIHLVKHIVHLPVTYHQPDIPRIILAEGRLMLFLDVTESVKTYQQEIDWQLFVNLTHDYGAGEMVGPVLHVCWRYLQAPVPEWVRASLSVAPPGHVRQRLCRRMAAHSVATLNGTQTSAFWRFMVAENYKFTFRPIRLLDFVTYAWPRSDFLQRRYGRCRTTSRCLVTAVYHFIKTLGEYLRLGIDTLHYTWQRKRGRVPTFVTRHE